MTMYMGSGGSNFGTAGSMLFGANGSVFVAGLAVGDVANANPPPQDG